MEQFIFIYLVIIISAVFHEYAHGLAAYQLGDKTAYYAGRLTLNPLAHIDPFGTVILPLLLVLSSGIFIGWAKPVPYNPHNLSDKKYGSLKVAIAGPIANLIIALSIGLLLRFLIIPLFLAGSLSSNLVELLGFVVYVNIVLAIFNLIPIPPLDGSKVLGDLFPSFYRPLLSLGFLGIFLALLIAFLIIPTLSETLFQIIVGSSLFS